MSELHWSDPLEQAVHDYLNGDKKAHILIHSNMADTELVAVSYFFRSYSEMPLLERTALDLCEGKILDVGAGAGSHSIFLQESGEDVTALDIRPGLVDAMKKRNISKVVEADVYEYDKEKFDCLLLLMNGIGFAASFEGVSSFLKHAHHLLNDGGSIILDSSDILYMYEQEDGSVLIDLNEDYYGIVEYNFEYNSVVSDKFKWIYIDISNLTRLANENGFDCELIYEDDHFNYLARLHKLS